MFSFNKRRVKVSICVPVFGTEKKLLACLESVGNQSFRDLELIVVDDASTSTDEQGRNCKKIVKAFAKKVEFPVRFLQHSRNRGAVESRRTALYQAKGKYVFFLDSDDTLPVSSIECLYKTALSTGASLVHGKANLAAVNSANESPEIQERIVKSIGLVNIGEMTGREVFEAWVLHKKYNGFLWGKLYERELLLDAFNHIPEVFCVMSEDFLIFFWITYEIALQNAKYFGIDEYVYNYFVEEGISSCSKITSLEHWFKHCTAASVFTLIFSTIQEMKENGSETLITEEISDILHKYCNGFLLLNLKTLRQNVIPELQKDAYTMLCDWWGEDFVEQIAKHL